MDNYEGSVSVPVYRKKQIITYTLIDIIDFSIFAPFGYCINSKGHAWHLNHNGYVYRAVTVNGKTKLLQLANVIMGLPLIFDGRVVDHINRNKLDNRRCNLRILGWHENCQNLPLISDTTSQYRGVSFDSRIKKWYVSMRINGKPTGFGRFDDEHEAGRVAVEVRKLHMPYAVEVRKLHMPYAVD